MDTSLPRGQTFSLFYERPNRARDIKHDPDVQAEFVLLDLSQPRLLVTEYASDFFQRQAALLSLLPQVPRPLELDLVVRL